jgi:hypothetical protein
LNTTKTTVEKTISTKTESIDLQTTDKFEDKTETNITKRRKGGDFN